MCLQLYNYNSNSETKKVNCVTSVFDTDQGSQFTSNDFTKALEEKEIKISMDGKGRALDNIFVERLWRSVKYEEVYLNDYRTVKDANQGLQKYFSFYNSERIHQSLQYQTPEKIYMGSIK